MLVLTEGQKAGQIILKLRIKDLWWFQEAFFKNTWRQCRSWYFKIVKYSVFIEKFFSSFLLVLGLLFSSLILICVSNIGDLSFFLTQAFSARHFSPSATSTRTHLSQYIVFLFCSILCIFYFLKSSSFVHVLFGNSNFHVYRDFLHSLLY